jgi:glycosyltransferase involved in cell wall biosynthesis
MKGLSVIIPYRNRLQCIDKCFEGLFMQEVPFPLEIVLVDHHSTDGSISYIYDKWPKIEGLSVYRYTPPAKFNLARARNIGIYLAKYDLVFTFDIDSILLRLDALANIYELWHLYEFQARVGRVADLEQFATQPLTKTEVVDYESSLYKKNGVVLRTVGWGNCVFHRDLFYQVGGLNHHKFKGKGYEDMAFFLIAFRQGYYPVQVWDMKNRRENIWLVNCKDHDLPEHLRVEMDDEWEGGCDEKAKEKSYRKFRLLVEKTPKVMRNDIDFNELIGNTEKIL